MADIPENTSPVGMKRQAFRDKNWDELTDTEKIERTRREVKHLQETVDYLVERVNKLRDHQHDSAQKILIPLDSNYSERKGLDRRGSDYF